MNAITNIRKRLGLTQAAFAQALEVDQSTVSRWEQDKLAPDLNDLRKIRALAKKSLENWDDSLFFRASRKVA
jgi:transcriptional regulator with XRE-family HTH domain